jgi:hypothetical protein
MSVYLMNLYYGYISRLRELQIIPVWSFITKSDVFSIEVFLAINNMH